MRRAWVGLLISLAACDGSTATDGGMQGDGGSAPDGGAPDATVGCECGSDEACVRGVCVASCGLDLSDFDTALGEGLTPVAHFCRPAAAYGVHVSGADATVYDLTATTDALRTTLVLSRWALDPSTPSPEPIEIASAPRDVASADELLFPSGFVAIDPSGARAAIGFTTSATGQPGELLVVTLGDGTVLSEPAPGNFDAAWLDPSRVVVNGMGLAGLELGQGLYLGDFASAPTASHIGTNMGDYSGSVIASPAFVIAGGVVDGTFESHAYFVPNERIETAIADATAIDVSSDAAVSEVLDPDGAALSSTFSGVDTRLLGAPYGGPLTSYAVALDAGAVTLSDPRVLATGGTFTDAIAAGGGRVLLVHTDPLTFSAVSLLLVEP